MRGSFATHGQTDTKITDGDRGLVVSGCLFACLVDLHFATSGRVFDGVESDGHAEALAWRTMRRIAAAGSRRA